MAANNDSILVQEYHDTDFAKKVVLTCTFDTGDGSFSKVLDAGKMAGYLLKMVTVPVSAPTADYDITLKDAAGLDVLETLGTDRHTTSTEKVDLVTGTYFHPFIVASDALTLAITGNSETSAGTIITIYYSAASG